MEILRPREGKGHDLMLICLEGWTWDLVSWLLGRGPPPSLGQPVMRAAGDEGGRAGAAEPMKACSLCEVDTDCTVRGSVTGHWGHSGGLTADGFGKARLEGQHGDRACWANQTSS